MNPPRLRPAFAMDALLLLEDGAANEAALLCVSGLGMYPDYLGGYVLLSRAYRALERIHDAQVILEEAQRRFPSFVAVAEQAAPSAVQAPPSTAPSAAPFPEPPAAPEAPLQLVVQPHANADDGVQGSSELHDAPPSGVELERMTPSPTVSPLRIIDTARIGSDNRIIRSASVRLIPGLEYTTLRFEGTKTRGRREIQTIADPPPFRRFHPARRVLAPNPLLTATGVVPGQKSSAKTVQRPASKPLSLEELANRLERARMPRPTDAPAPAGHIVQPRQVALVTETIARIYMQQGAYEKAIEAFTTLAQSKPEKRAEFEQIIADLTTKLNS